MLSGQVEKLKLIPMTMGEFIKFLRRHSNDSIKEGSHILTEDYGKNMAYGDVRGLIDAFLIDYAGQTKHRKNAEKAFLEAIETDERRDFNDPVELIKHIREIANRPGFLDNEQISLTVIAAFCNDFITRYNVEQHKELLKQAPF